ncbi:MAG TPA: thioredoxin [Anaerovoracaceae bacterium]|nr:thioredoxin [Anaerovoracaceae bacterium]
MSIVHLTKENFEAEVVKADVPVLIDFFANWCGPCKMQTPILEELAGEMSDAKICKVDVDSEPDLARQFGVMSIPTLMVMKNGEVTFKQPGLRQKRDLLELLK